VQVHLDPCSSVCKLSLLSDVRSSRPHPHTCCWRMGGATLLSSAALLWTGALWCPFTQFWEVRAVGSSWGCTSELDKAAGLWAPETVRTLAKVAAPLGQCISPAPSGTGPRAVMQKVTWKPGCVLTCGGHKYVTVPWLWLRVPRALCCAMATGVQGGGHVLGPRSYKCRG